MEHNNPEQIKSHLHFENLDGLRFFGALAVFIFHIFTLNREIWGDFTQGTIFKITYKMANKGHHGVGLFFVLSGFLITYLILTELKKTGKIGIRNFLMRRILRIWPVYYLLVIFGFAIFPQLPFGQETSHSLWMHMLYLSNFSELMYGVNENLNFLTISWSVSIEEQFYWTWMLLLAVAPMLRQQKFFHGYFITLVIASVIFRLFFAYDDRTIYFHSLSVVSDLAIGGLAAYYVIKGKLKEFIYRFSRFQIMLFYLVGIGFIATSSVFEHPIWVAVTRISTGIFFAFIILEQAFSANSFIKMDRLPYFKFSGKITYGFYMYHSIFIYYFSIIWNNNGWTESIFQFLSYALCVFVCTYALSILSFKWIEEPLLRFKKYFR